MRTFEQVKLKRNITYTVRRADVLKFHPCPNGVDWFDERSRRGVATITNQEILATLAEGDVRVKGYILFGQTHGLIPCLTLEDETLCSLGYIDANLHGLFLTSVRMSRSVFQRTNVVRALATSSSFRSTYWRYGTIANSSFYHCAFQDASFSGTNLRSTVFDGCDFQGVCLHGINSCELRFHRARLQRAEFRSVDLEGFSCTDCVLRNAVFDDCSMLNARFRHCDMRGTKFTGIRSLGTVVFDHCKRSDKDQPIPGWKVNAGILVRE